MYSINFSENLARLRREKRITQEQLANFFDITIDELIGYEPKLSTEQITMYKIQQLELGGNIPRDKNVIFGSALQGLEMPVFDVIKEEKVFQNLKDRLVRNIKQ